MLDFHKDDAKLLFLGDLLYDHDRVLPDISALGKHFQQSGYFTVLNLEAPLRSGTPINKWINLYQTEHIIEILKLLNVVAVNIANNHILDWGEKGLRRLLRELDAHGILHFGAGMTLAESLSPVIVRVNDKRFGFLGYGWYEEMCVYATASQAGVAPLKKKIIEYSLRQLKETVDFVVINLHWGYEYELYPLPIHRRLAQDLVNAGADIVIGHHPHVIQAYEVYQRKHIYYSLGDFYFGSLRNRFESIVEDEDVKNLSRYGLGIVLDASTEHIHRIFFKIEQSQTNLSSAEFELKELSNVSLHTYDNNYPSWRTSSRKPTLYCGPLHELLLNPLKLSLSHFKDWVHRLVRPGLEKLGVYSTLKKTFRAITR
mgnify:CR=1 FL=1